MRNRIVSAILASTLAAGSPALASTCPGDLSGLSGQITTEKVRSMLDKPIEQLITDAGSPQAALAKAEADVSRHQAGLQALPPGSSASLTRLYEDALTVATARVAALKCRLQSSN